MGPLIGLAQALEAPQPAKGIGAALIRGQGYGFLAWIAVLGGGPRWSVELAREVTVGTPVPPVVVLCAAGLGLGLLYGLLFRRLDPNLTTAVGRGRFLWWALGALTLLPVLEGEGTRWSAAEAAGVFTVLPRPRRGLRYRNSSYTGGKVPIRPTSSSAMVSRKALNMCSSRSRRRAWRFTQAIR